MVALLGGVEIGGTKCTALVAHGRDIVDRIDLPTTDPAATLAALAGWLAQHDIAALGIASFGPLGLDPARADYGCITTTPKPGWAGCDLLAAFAALAVPAAIDTDVAGAALAEGRWGAAQGCAVHVYLTIGTGIGGGVVVDGRAVHGRIHPELGHVRVRRQPGDSFAGICPYHGDCLEGLASGPAIAARTGTAAHLLPPDHPVWPAVAAEIAELCALLVLTLSPQRISIGGGVGMGQPQLLAPIRAHVADLLGGYVDGFDPAAFIGPPGLGDLAGPLGAIALAELAYSRKRTPTE